MVSAILGKKLGMTQLFIEDKCFPVTVIEVGPCTVLQIKNKEKDGYNALQLGYAEKKKKRASRAEQGHAEKHAKSTPKKFIKEIEWDGKEEVKTGDEVTVNIFEKIRYVDVTGTTKGRGFQGGVKRHGFAGGPKSHGQSDRLRAPGSIGCSATPSRVYKGVKMSGQMGNAKRTSRNLQVIDIDEKKGLISVKGSIPGPNGGFVIVKRSLIN